MKALVIYLTVLITATSLRAEDRFAFQMADIPSGTHAVYKDEGGKRFSVLYLGKQGGDFVIEARMGETKKGGLSHTYYVDERGQRKRLITADGEWSYKPHFCTRTMGSCRFRVINETTGRASSMQRVTKDDGNGRFSHVLYLNGQVFEEGWFVPGQFGIPSEYYWNRNTGSHMGTLLGILIPE